MMSSALSLKLMGALWVVGVVLYLGNTGGVGAAPGFVGTTFTDRLPGVDSPGPWPTWLEGPDNTILMSFVLDGEVHIASSQDVGRSWQVYATIQTEGKGFAPCISGYFTRLSETTLLLRVYADTHSYWVRSDDNGRTWSQSISVVAGIGGGTAPIRVMSDGRWAAAHDRRRADGGYDACVLWSSDQGQTWGEPITFPTPVDGNKCISENDIVELGPNSYVAAIRADEGMEGSWDGFYLSWSNDGLEWSAPVPLGDRGRMPLFYRVGNLWALCYRLYDAALGIQHSAIRFSRDGKDWSPPMLIEHGVNAAPFIVQVDRRIIAFNTRYPERTRITRDDITAKVRQLLGHAGTIN